MKSKEQIVAEYERNSRSTVSGLTVTRIDLSFSNIFWLALKFGIVWFLMGIAGALLVNAIL